jgi:hypothetical protein
VPTIAFQGAYTFATADDARDALASTAELVADEDAAFRAAWRTGRFLRADGAVVLVDVALQGPEDWWDAVAALVDELADEADSGTVTSTSPDGEVVVIDAEERVEGDEP